MKSVAEQLGIYVSIPFCKAKCTFCNFASQAFPPERMQAYVDRLICEIAAAREFADRNRMKLPSKADTVFFGGGTPSLLSPKQFRALMATLRECFGFDGGAEITLEAAPGQVSDELLETICAQGVNRVSLGVQSFVDAESRAVGRMHTGEQCLGELQRLADAGIRNRNVDLIAGLPHQNEQSWQHSLQAAVNSGAEHVSVYMLEVDEESNLGREVTTIRATSQLEVLGQQARYSASAVPADETCAELYGQACSFLQLRGVAQYEISNFARESFQSRHNRKYWIRAPYLGLGLDAHSMLRANAGGTALRFAQTDDLSNYLEAKQTPQVELVEGTAAFEEEIFLGLRLVEGIDLERLRQNFGAIRLDDLNQRARELEEHGWMESSNGKLRLTTQGRLVSSSIFGELLATTEAQVS